MYALVNLPGSQNFDWFGPASKSECEAWLEEAKIFHQDRYGGLWTSTYYPARIVPNKEARAMRWRDGNRVIRDDWR